MSELVTEVVATRLRSRAKLPERAHEGDAGFDLFAAEAIVIGGWQLEVVRTGLAIAVPSGTVGLIVSRSGLARKWRVTVANAPGVLDSGYRGEVEVLLENRGEHRYQVRLHDRVAQLIVVRCGLVNLTEAPVLPGAEDGRADGGFGSTGR